MGAFSMRVTGLQQLRRSLREASRQIRSATVAALYEDAQGTMDESQKLVPVDTGALFRSASVTRPGLSRPIATLGYGVDYATLVHERIEIPHKNGQAKFLETAINKRSGGFVRRVARKTKRNIEKKIGIRSVQAEYPTRAMA